MWRESKGDDNLAQIFVSPEYSLPVKHLLSRHGFIYSTLIEDVGKNISVQLKRLDARRGEDGRMTYDYSDYNDFDSV